MSTNPLDSQYVKVENTTPLVGTVELQKLSTKLNPHTKVAASCIAFPQLYAATKEVRVAMAEMKIESKPIDLVTSVGSCVALCLYDSTNKCGGLAHIMLPNSAIAPQNALPYKFADTAVPALAMTIRKISGKESYLVAKIAGGANLFSSLNSNSQPLGVKNVEAVKAALSANKIKLTAEDVGGPYGRRIAFNIGNGIVTIRLSNGEIKKL